jgi:hypothetical protein
MNLASHHMPRMTSALAALLGLLCLTGTTRAQQAATQSILEQEIPIQRTVLGRIPEQHLTVAGVTVGSDTLLSAQSKLGGHATRFFAGNASHVCYVAGSAADPVALVFEATGMGAFETITSFYLARPSTLGTHAAECRTRLITRSLTTPGGLRLGAARADVIKLFHTKPIVDSPTQLGFYYRSASSSTNGLVHWSGAHLTFSEGRTDAVVVYASEERE